MPMSSPARTESGNSLSPREEEELINTSPLDASTPRTGDAPEFAVEAVGLCKTYAASAGAIQKPVLSDVDLAIPRGSLFGLLGPNGAGKSTFINILAGLTRKSSGLVKLWGIDIDEDHRRARAAIGVVPQELNIDPFFTPFDLLEIHAGLYGVPASRRRTPEILEAVGLLDKAHAYARTLSGGMRRRLMVAKALVHTPPVLVLDEPTAGVDIDLRRKLWAHVRDLNERGTTILLTTHYLEEAEQLCDRIAIINHGRLAACDTTEALLQRIGEKGLAILLDCDLDAVPPALAQGPVGAACKVSLPAPRRLLFRYRLAQTSIAEILDAVAVEGLTIVDLTTEETDLEDIFLQITHGPPDNELDSGADGEAEAGEDTGEDIGGGGDVPLVAP